MNGKRIASKLDYQLSVINRRKEIARHIMADFLVGGQLVPLSETQKRAVERVWGDRKQFFDWRWFELYNWSCPEIGTDIWKFIPVDYWLTYIDPIFAHPINGLVFDDKNMYDLYFPDVKQPKTVVRYIDGCFMDLGYHIIGEEDALKRCEEARNVVIKPAVGTCGGSGIVFWNGENSTREELKQLFRKRSCYIVQEVVRQHPIMASLNESSCNTIRMISFLYEGEVVVIPTAFTRFGGKGSLLDNVSSGGYGVGIDSEGKISSISRNHYEETVATPGADETRFIPNYSKCQSIARQVAPRLSHITKLIAWDFAIGKDSEPLLIEVNFERTSIQTFQSLNGPIFGDYVEYFLQKVTNHYVPKNPLYRGLVNMMSKMK